MIRHVYNGEYRWTEVNLVCTKKNESDLLLQRVAKSIQESIPENSIAMRIGGDEFLIMCADCSVERVSQIVESIRQRMVRNSDEVLKLSASFGTCTVENDNISFRDAYNIADQAMYEEKKKH